MKTLPPFLLLLLSTTLMSCAQKKKPDDVSYDDKLQGTLAIPSYTRNALDGWPQGRKLDPYDATRVRFAENIHAYHVGRLPSRDRREMHEAHSVYRVEQTGRWDQRLPATPMESRGVVLGIREPANDPVPKDEVVANERARQQQFSTELKMRLTDLAEKQKKLDEYLTSAPDKNKTIAELSTGKARAEQDLAASQAELKRLKSDLRELKEQQAIESALNLGMPVPQPSPPAQPQK